jgi:aminoglycoside 6'-N-acetyltransferase I
MTSPGPIVYREAVFDDIGDLARIRATEWGTEPYWRDRISGYMKGELHPQHALAPRVVFVASQGGGGGGEGVIVGFIAGHLTRRFACDGELEWINVIAGRRRTGVAAELLRRLARWFAGRQARRVCVDVDPQNEPARAFYRSHGATDLNPHWLVWSDIVAVANESRVRLAAPGDAAAWLGLRQALWPEGTEAEHRREIERFFDGTAAEPLAVLLAEDGTGSPVGCAELSIRAHAEGCHSDRVAYLEGWFVVPRARGRGVGRALIAAAERWGRAQGCSELASDAQLDNAVSAAAHRALGFTEVGLLRCFRKDL